MPDDVVAVVKRQAVEAPSHNPADIFKSSLASVKVNQPQHVADYQEVDMYRIQKMVVRARDFHAPETDFGLVLRDSLALHMVESPAVDQQRPWFFAHNLDGPEYDRYVAWTTHTMLQTPHFWLQATTK